jgi:hypothetical protein
MMQPVNHACPLWDIESIPTPPNLGISRWEQRPQPPPSAPDSSVEAPLAAFSLKGLAIAVDNLPNSRPSFPLTGRPPIDGKCDG